MLTIISTPINKLREDKRNARLHDRKNLDAIKGSLAKFGQQKPIVVDKKGNIIAGNGTYAAAKELGWDSIDVVQTDLDGDNVKAYALADNRSAELAIWNDGILGELLQELRENDFPIADIGFDPGDFFDDKGTEGLTDPDEVPEVPQNVRGVQRGQIWQLGDHRMMCGDSTSKEDVERLMAGEKADMVFTDPPYGVSYDGGIQFTAAGVKKGQRTKLANDDTADIYSLAVPLMAVFCDGPIYVWFADSEARQLYQAIENADGTIHAMVVWVKNGGYGALNACYKQKHEPCLFWKAKGTLRWSGPTTENTIWEIQKDGRNDLHPTQKPVSLAERAISNHDAKSVLDLFLGSGSTLIACEKTGRKCFGMEIDPHYCSVIIERFEKFSGKKAVLLNAKS